MADMDFSEVHALSASIGRASADVVKAAHGVLAKGALNIKNDTRANIPSRYWDRLIPKVNYELVGLMAEVGYEDVGAGELAGIYEFGSSKRAPHPTLYPAADREAPKFEKAMADAAVKLIEDAL